MMEKFDVLVIGGGVGGNAVALGSASQGKKVAIVEERDWGGTTINRGSTPKRALLVGAEAHYKLRQLFNDVQPLTWQQMFNHSAAVTMSANQRFSERLNDANVTKIEGHAQFVDDKTIEVAGNQYYGEKVVIATGAHPRMLDFPGSNYLQHSASFLKNSNMPDNITIIGAGIISFALASIASEAGISVTIVQHDNLALKLFDPELVQILVSQLQKNGVEFKFNTNVTSIEKGTDNIFTVNTDKGSFETKDVYCVIGRIANIDDLNLDQTGVDVNERGIKVSDELQTSNPDIYALGDCCDAPVPKLSSYAIFQGKYLARSLNDANSFEIKYPIPAMTVFSLPKLGRVGMSVQEGSQNLDYQIKQIKIGEFQTYARNGDDIATMKVVVNKGSQRIVGAEILSQNADQLVDFLSLLIQQRITADDLTQQLFAYPSVASDLYGIWQSK